MLEPCRKTHLNNVTNREYIRRSRRLDVISLVFRAADNFLGSRIHPDIDCSQIEVVCERFPA